MFKDRDDARAVFNERCFVPGRFDPAPSVAQCDAILDRLVPQFAFQHRGDSDAPRGATRLGGAPDMAKGTPWPPRPVPPDVTAIVAGLYEGHKWIGDHLVRELPFEFVAQIDLAEASLSPRIAGALPDHGRLLFFWDGVAGGMFGGPAACRVIWDESPADQLERLAIPPVLHELEAAYDPSGRFTKPYIWPSRAMRLAPIVHLPGRHTCEVELDAELPAPLKNNTFDGCYDMMASLDDESHARRLDRGSRRQRFMGLPDPEQDDPRYTAIEARIGAYPWTGDRLREASRLGGEWQLVLQLDLGDLSQQPLTEGTLYFVIHRDDLARRDFGRVHAYYQQT